MARNPKDAPLPDSRNVKLFRNGRNQAVRIPREFELPGDVAVLRKEGHRLILEPAARRGLLELVASFDKLDESFPDVDASLPPVEDVEI